MTPLLHIDELHVELPVGDELRPVLYDTSLTVDAGEALGLVGESGAGKSMTARAVLRLLPPGAQVSGRVLFEGRDVLRFGREELRRFLASDAAMIFQDPTTHINPVRKIGDFLTEALTTNDGMADDEARRLVKGILEEVGIDDAERRLGQYPHELSGGLLQRVMIASALAIKPRLLLADEPTTSLDVTTQAEVMAILDEQRHERGLAMVFVTHDLELAAAVCDRIAVMYAGFLMEDRPAEALREKALHPYTRALLASRPSAAEKARRLTTIPGRPLSAFEVEDGCAFTTRCPYVQQRCRDERPELRELDGGRVRCHRAEEVRDGAAAPQAATAQAEPPAEKAEMPVTARRDGAGPQSGEARG